MNVVSVFIGIVAGFLLGVWFTIWFTKDVINSFVDKLVEKLVARMAEDVKKAIEYQVAEPLRHGGADYFAQYEHFRTQEEKQEKEG